MFRRPMQSYNMEELSETSVTLAASEKVHSNILLPFAIADRMVFRDALLVEDLPEAPTPRILDWRSTSTQWLK